MSKLSTLTLELSLLSGPELAAAFSAAFYRERASLKAMGFDEHDAHFMTMGLLEKSLLNAHEVAEGKPSAVDLRLQTSGYTLN
jgi:hypothetical protein